MQFENFRCQINGRCIQPIDPDYDQLRQAFPGDIDRRPVVIVLAADTQDVVKVIEFSKASGLRLAVRSGGHSSAGHGVVEGGIVLDLREMNKIEVNADERTAWIQPGATASQVTKRIADDGLVLGFGDTGSVGVGGITTSGGIGFLVRKFGMAIDNLLAAEIVTAKGEVLTIDDAHHPDLFWAVRGGGSNFGVVVNFKFRLQPLSKGYGGMLILPATAKVISGCLTLAEQAPEELSAIFNVMSAPPMPFLPPEVHGKLIVMAMLFYAGDPVAGQKQIDQFRFLAQPLTDMARPMEYHEMFPPEAGGYHPLAVSKTMFMNSVDDVLGQTIVDQLQASDAPMRVVQMRVLGGALAKVSSEETAFAHRQSRILTNVASFYIGPEDLQRRQDWVQKTAQLLYQNDDGAYVGFMADEGEARVRAAYPGKTWERLVEVKKRYDSENIFQLNQNIKPENAQQN